MMRVRFAVALGFAVVAFCLPTALFGQETCSQEIQFGKPRPWAWEFSPFLGANLFSSDDEETLELDNQMSLGARIGFNWTRHWESEITLELAPDVRTKDLTVDNIDTTYLDVNMVFNLNTDPKQYGNFGRWINPDRWVPYFTFGAGYAGFDFDEEDSDDEFTVNAGLGTRLMLGRMAGLRIDARARVIPDADLVEVSPTAGLSLIMGGATLRDSDNDGVLDSDDRCPGTAQGCAVDCYGCHGDGDGDGVCDGVDRCPDTVAGCYVDAAGCALDGDGDGVCDGLDNCPDTPPGCWVDEKGCSEDSDGDGVCDGVDACPDTPDCCRVDARGCPLDGDDDGVCDGCDECPKSESGVRVDEKGCAMLKLVLADVYFDFNKATIRDFYYPFLDQVARSLKADNNLYVVLELEGHTDAVGSNRYNYELGERRAKAVKEYLVARGIDANRLVAASRGETDPAASNATAAGRLRNRRVEMHPRGPRVPASQIEQYRVPLPNIYFDTDKATLRDSTKPFLREIARVMMSPRFRGVPIILEGHADMRAGADYNRRLSQRRAEAVKSFLVREGLSATRIQIRALGESQAEGRSATTMQQDRRVQVHTR